MILALEKMSVDVPISAGDKLQWNNEGKFITAQAQSGKPLYWQGNQLKKMASWLRSDEQFDSYVMILAEILNLKAVLVEGERHRTYRFE